MNKFEYTRSLRECLKRSNIPFTESHGSIKCNFLIRTNHRSGHWYQESEEMQFYSEWRKWENETVDAETLISLLVKFREIPAWLDLQIDHTMEGPAHLFVSKRLNRGNQNTMKSESFPFRIKEPLHNGIGIFHCDKTSVFEYVIFIIILLALLGTIFLMAMPGAGQGSIGIIIMWLLFIILGVYFLTRKRFTGLRVNQQTAEILISYRLLFSRREMQRIFVYEHYQFDKIATKGGFYYRLKLIDASGKRVNICSNDMGFDKVQLCNIEGVL